MFSERLFSDVFSASIEMLMYFFLLYSTNTVNHIDLFLDITPTLHSGINVSGSKLIARLNLLKFLGFLHLYFDKYM